MALLLAASVSFGSSSPRAGFLDDLNKFGNKIKELGETTEDILRNGGGTDGGAENDGGTENDSGTQTQAPPEPDYNTDPQSVARAQRILNALGYDAGPEDGVYGARTQRAIRAFERGNKLPQRGDVTASVLSRLVQEADGRGIAVAAKKDPQHLPGHEAPAPEPKVADGAGTGSASAGDGGLVAPAPAAAAPSGPAAADQGGPQVSAASGASPGQQAQARRYRLSLARGLPVVGGGRYNLTDEQNAAIASFFDFVELALDPSLLEREALCWARHHLEPAEWQNYVLVGTEALNVPGKQAIAKELVAWRGQSEFERERAREAFLADHGQALRAKAASMPLQLVVVDEIRLPTYSREKGGFELPLADMSRRGLTFDELGTRGVRIPRPVCAPPFAFQPAAVALPDVWKIAPDEAERVLKTLREDQGYTGPPRKKIYLGFAFGFRAMPGAKVTSKHAAQQSDRVPVWSEVTSVGIYQDPDLERLIHELPLRQARPPILLSGVPDDLPPPRAMAFDEATLAQILLRDHGDALDAKAWDLLMGIQAQVDQLYYARQYDPTTVSGRLYAAKYTADHDDGYVPFFPPGFRGGNLTPAQIALFKQWSAKRAASMPAAITLWAELRRHRGDYSPSWSTVRTDRRQSALVAALQGKGYSANQLIGLDVGRSSSDRFNSSVLSDGDQNRQPVLVLPDIVPQYVPSPEEMRKAGEAGAQTVQLVIRLGRSELISVDQEGAGKGGRTQAFAVHGAPVGIRLLDSRSGNVLFEKRYEARELEPGRLDTPDLSVSAPAGEALPLSAEAMELLMVKHAPQSLSSADWRHMLLARWEYEASVPPAKGEPDWGRFFVPGKRKPDEAQQAELLPGFRKWTEERSAALPDTFRLVYSRVRVNDGAPVSTAAPFAPTHGGNPNERSAFMNGCRSEARSYPALEPGCLYLQNVIDNTPDIYPFGYGGAPAGPRFACSTTVVGTDVYCKARKEQYATDGSGRPAPDFRDVLVLDRELFFAGEKSALAGLRSDTGMVLDVSVETVRVQDRPVAEPFAEARSRYAAFRESLGLRPGTPAPGAPEDPARYFIFEAKVHSAELTKGKTHAPTARLEARPARVPDLEALEIPDSRSIPDGTSGPDVVGLRLGLSFEEADRLVRKHMKVEQVLVRDRSRDPKALSGNLERFASSRVYIAEGGSEMIILYDEPPSAAGVVLGITRQLSLPAGEVPPAAVLDQLREKYGKETWSGHYGDVGWGHGLAETTVHDSLEHTCLPSATNTALREWSDEKGGPEAGNQGTAPKSLPNMTMHKTPVGRNCGTVVGMKFTSGRAPAQDRLLIQMLDPNAYWQHHAESVRQVKSGKAVLGTEAAVPKIKF